MGDAEYNILYVPGSSEIKSSRATNNNSTTKAEWLRPSPGFRIRIISIEVVHEGATSNGIEVYFGDGTNISTNAGKEILEERSAAIDSLFRSWPDGAGPVGDPGEMITYRGTSAVAEDINLILHYREEPRI